MERVRLPAQARRAAVLETACRIFSQGSYRGTTTAEIAREAGVSEPILYRHFASKRELYLACLDEAWSGLRSTWERAIAGEPDSSRWLSALGSYMAAHQAKAQLSNLWVQALTEASDDAEIRKAMRAHLREVHGYVADLIRRAQEEGGIVAERDPTAEAWIFISLGLLGSIGRRLGGLVKEDFTRIIASRREWMTGQLSPSEAKD
jgi:AcrR family transcriptional regulator